MTATLSAAVTAAVPAWAWPLNLDRYQRHGHLCDVELDGLRVLGLERLRLDPDRDTQAWQAIRRLVTPLDDALLVLHWDRDNRHQRRFARNGAAIVLHRCAELGRAFWAWTSHDWAGLLDPAHLRTHYAGQVGISARRFLLAYGYLLAGFTAFELIGPFEREALAERVFGPAVVEAAIDPVREVLTGWGYRANELVSLVCAMLLLNRSPRLSDLTSETLAGLRANPAMRQHHHVRHLHGIHRALAALGHAEPPATPKYGDGPAPITGTAAAWAQWVERWNATSTLEPTTRSIYRVILAKIGRWLAAEHPDVAEPADWTRPRPARPGSPRSTAVRVGDHIQSDTWRDSRSDQLGKPLSPKTKRTYMPHRPHLLPRSPGLGLDPAPVRPRACAGNPAQHPSPTGTRSTRDHRRPLGQTALGRSQPRPHRPARRPRRPPGRHGPRDHPHLAVQRPAQRRNRPAARRLHPLALPANFSRRRPPIS